MNEAVRKTAQAVHDLMDGITDVEMRELGVEALRQWRKRPPPNPRFDGSKPVGHNEPPPDPIADSTKDIFAIHADLGHELLKLLAARRSHPEPHAEKTLHGLREAFQNGETMSTSWMQSVLEFIWWLQRAGLATVIQRASDGYQNPILFRLTNRGLALLERGDDNPLLPGFLDRIRERCPRLPDGVLSLLVDARALLDHSFGRPAVVLMGVAYELAIEEVISKLAPVNYVKADTLTKEAGERLKRVRDFVRSEKFETLFPDNRDARKRAEAAYDFADTLRLRRNDAAHTRPAYDFDHEGENDEFLISAGRHLPAIWSLAVACEAATAPPS